MAFQASMAEALRLTRSGNLMGAAALLRSTLDPSKARAPSARGSANEPIDLVPGATKPTDAPPPEELTRGPARFEEQLYQGREGTIGYWLYRPAQASAGMPLIVMLHGCTQSPQDFARGTAMNRLADELGFLVAYPQQSASANPQKCWNWFKPGDQQRDKGEPALLAAITREVIARHGVDADRVYIAGLSAGGAAAAIMASEYPELYAAVGVHSGLACGAARDLPSALSAMKRGGGTAATARDGQRFVPVITFHGDRDTTVHEVNSREIVAAASAAAGVPLSVHIDEGSSAGRSYRREASADPQGNVLIEQWTIGGSGHAWSGGDRAGSYADPSGPDASREMVRFFLERKRA